MVDYSSIFPSDEQPTINYFTLFRDKSIGQSGKNNSVPIFRIYRKHLLPVNMADINKLEIEDKTVSLLHKNT